MSVLFGFAAGAVLHLREIVSTALWATATTTSYFCLAYTLQVTTKDRFVFFQVPVALKWSIFLRCCRRNEASHCLLHKMKHAIIL